MAGANTANILAKYKRNSQAAAEDYVAGVQAVTVSPTQKAAAAVDKYARGVQNAVTSGSFVSGCNSVSLADWQQAAMSKGKKNYQNGVANLSAKAMKNMADQQNYAALVKAEIANMPNDSEADADARQAAAVAKMRAYRKR